MSEKPISRQRNWRPRENRLSARHLAKRVSQEDHEVVTAYAKSLNVPVAVLLDPAVNELVARARAYMAERQQTPEAGGLSVVGSNFGP